jgi:beta-lactamase regulating signal transducer with metallopeptidase domain
VILWFLASLVIATSLIATATAALTKLISRASASDRHSIWLGATAAMVATPVTWLSFGGIWSIPVRHDSLILNTGPTSRVAVLIMLVWVAGAALVCTIVLAEAVRTRRNARRPAPDNATWLDQWAEIADEARRMIGVSSPLSILESTSEATPITWGVHRPVIVLPSSASDWSLARRWAVLLHELSHIRRRDYLVELFLLAATIAYWFHPAIWWAARRVREEREMACDELVLAAGVPPVDYAEHLVEIARGVVRERRPAIVGLRVARRTGMEGRVARILDARAGQNRGHAAGAVLLWTFVAALLLGTATPIARALPARAAKAKCDCAAKRRARAKAAAARQSLTVAERPRPTSN